MPSARSRPNVREWSRMFHSRVYFMSRERSNSPRCPAHRRDGSTSRPIRRARWIVASHTDARRTRERIAREFFLKRTETRFTASLFERLETRRRMLGAMGRGRSRAEAMMMMDAMTTMDDVSTALLGCGGGRRNERATPRVEETTRGFLITVHAPGARAEDVRARATTDARGRGGPVAERSATNTSLWRRVASLDVDDGRSVVSERARRRSGS